MAKSYCGVSANAQLVHFWVDAALSLWVEPGYAPGLREVGQEWLCVIPGATQHFPPFSTNSRDGK